MKKAGTATTKPKLTKDTIMNWYMEDVLEGREPKNVYLFSKEHGISEDEF